MKIISNLYTYLCAVIATLFVYASTRNKVLEAEYWAWGHKNWGEGWDLAVRTVRLPLDPPMDQGCPIIFLE